MKSHRFMLTAVILALVLVLIASSRAAERSLWKPVAFAIVKFMARPPEIVEPLSHGTQTRPAPGASLEALFAPHMKEQEVYEIDPQTVKPHGEDVELSNS